MRHLVWLAYQQTLSLQEKVCNYNAFSLGCCFPKKDFLVGNIGITTVRRISDQTDMYWVQLLLHLAYFCVYYLMWILHPLSWEPTWCCTLFNCVELTWVFLLKFLVYW